MSNALKTQTIDDKIKAFAKLKDKRQKLQALQKELDEHYNALREDLRQVMAEKKVLTLKTEEYTITRSSRRVIKIVDHNKLIDWFTKRGITPPLKVDYYPALPVLNEAFKQGKKIKGAEESSAEYVSVRINKPKKKGGDK
jgi:hypothetical protein